jgi:hypothetical protein
MAFDLYPDLQHFFDAYRRVRGALAKPEIAAIQKILNAAIGALDAEMTDRSRMLSERPEPRPAVFYMDCLRTMPPQVYAL